ncbi:MAG: asparagine synthase (glutamine-hydrolyzing), partial [Gammaproteobacteria bacterium]
MCGIAGIISLNPNLPLNDIVSAMNNTIIHRGPDGDGIFRDVFICLGHRRLAIIDPEHGKQPLTTLDGRYTVTFNGEIYNYLELRRELISKGHPIHSYSDTEIIPYAYIEWGKDCVLHFRGMFAFAIWDNKEQELFCARDRIGIKPFYYFFDNNHFIFASEIKALFASGLVKAEYDKQGLQDYITFQFCLQNLTLFKNILKLEPGTWLNLKKQKEKFDLKIRSYWNLSYEVCERQDEKYYTDNLLYLLEESMNLHLRSDVPLGAHLSGGLDSSTVVSLASRILEGNKLKTFTGAFREGLEYDETGYARMVAEATNCDYNEVFISGEDFTSIFPKLIYHMDEPLAGPGLIPQYFVSKLAAEQVKVVLGGQGGDELYVGYARYFIAYLEKCLAAAIWPEQTQLDHGLSLVGMISNLPLLNTYKPMLKHFLSDGLFENE